MGYIRRKIDISTCGWGIGLPSSSKRKEKRGALKLINKYSSILAPSSSPSRHNSMRKSEKLDTFLIKPNFFSCQIEKLVQLRWHTSSCARNERGIWGVVGMAQLLVVKRKRDISIHSKSKLNLTLLNSEGTTFPHKNTQMPN